MCTARPNWLSLSTTFFNKEECHKVSLVIFVVLLMVFPQVPLPLYDILALDEENLTVTVEPMVTVSANILETYSKTNKEAHYERTLGLLVGDSLKTRFEYEVRIYCQSQTNLKVVKWG